VSTPKRPRVLRISHSCRNPSDGLRRAETGGRGISVIGSDAGAIPDVVGKVGRIYTKSQRVELAKSIRMPRNIPELRSTVGEERRMQAIEKYSLELVAADYIGVMKFLSEPQFS
jgi:hypothetical protein